MPNVRTLLFAVVLLLSAVQPASAQVCDSLWQDAIQFQENGFYDKAIDKYKEALEYASDANLWFALGTAYQAKGDLENARTAYQHASILAYRNSSYDNALRKLTNSSALPYVKEAIRKQTTANINGNCDLKGAIEEYKRALAIDDSPAIWYDLATVYFAVGDYRNMRDAFKRSGSNVPILPKEESDQHPTWAERVAREMTKAKPTAGDILTPDGDPIRNMQPNQSWKRKVPWQP